MIQSIEAMKADLSDHERRKYEHVWTFPDYRLYSPGEQRADRIVAWLSKVMAIRVVDVGCGPGRLTKILDEADFDVVGIDVAENCLDPDLGVRFERRCLWNDGIPDCDATVSSDVLEHLPTSVVELSVENIAAAAPHGWHHIALGPDGAGPELIGEPLHLTQRPAEFWISLFQSKLGRTITGEEHNDLQLSLWY